MIRSGRRDLQGETTRNAYSSPDVVILPPVTLGEHELTIGEHNLTVEIVGGNNDAIKAYMFGLDQVLLEVAK